MNILFIVKDINIEHLNIMLLAKILKDGGHDVDLVSSKIGRVKKKLNEKKYDVLAYNTPTIYHRHYLDINRAIKSSWDVFSIFGGPHPTFVPEMIYEHGVDAICRGEGEYAFLELANNLSEGKPVRSIKNLWVKENGEIFMNPPRPLIENLDSLPYPDRYFFPVNETFSKGKMHVITGRGCPYNCSYCSHPMYNKLYDNKAGTVRRRSVKDVLSEIKQVASKTSLKLVMFEDDLFTSSMEWLDEFCIGYETEVNVPFFCYSRAEHLKPELVKKLKRSGCVTISFGLETADDNLRNNILKRGMSTKTILDAVAAVKNEKLKLETMNIVGIPGGNLDSDFETLKMNISCRPDYSSVKLLMPYPGTQIREYAKKRDMLIEEYPSSSWESSVKFRNKKEKESVENLCKLFAVTVEFPLLMHIIRKLICMPFGKLYRVVNLAWDGYASFFRLYKTGWRGLIAGIRKYINIFGKSLQ